MSNVIHFDFAAVRRTPAVSSAIAPDAGDAPKPTFVPQKTASSARLERAVESAEERAEDLRREAGELRDSGARMRQASEAVRAANSRLDQTLANIDFKDLIAQAHRMRDLV